MKWMSEVAEGGRDVKGFEEDDSSEKPKSWHCYIWYSYRLLSSQYS